MVREHNGWLVAGNCTLLMVCLGTVYAWSFFQKTLAETYGWTNSQVAWAFSHFSFLLPSRRRDC